MCQTVSDLQSELAKQRMAAREIEERQKTKVAELVALRDREKAARAESAELQSRVEDLTLRLGEETNEYDEGVTEG